MRTCARSRARLAPSAMRRAISRFRKRARASRRFATFAHAISSTIAATPATHTAMRDTGLAPGPRWSTIGSAVARGRAESTGAIRLMARSASQLRRYTFVRSAFVAARSTLGFRRTSNDSHPQLYVVW